VKTLLGLGLMVLHAFPMLAWSNVKPLADCQRMAAPARHPALACMSLPAAPAPKLVIR
jgi:hypothetical protein